MQNKKVEKMAGEKMAEQINERRRRSRASSNLNANFNGGGVFLLLGAAAGTLLASAFAAHRILAHKRRKGSTADDKIQVNSDENLDASFQISEAERSLETDVESVDGKIAGFRDSNADIRSCSSLGEKQLRYCDNELVGASVEEERKFSCETSKEDDEGRKTAYKEEQSKLLEDNFGNHLHLVDEQEIGGGANTRERRVQANTSDDLHGSLEIFDFIKRESDINLVEIAAERNSAKETKLDGIEELACLKGSQTKVIHHLEIGSSQANVHNNLEIYNNLGEDQLRYDDEQLMTESFNEEIEAPFINKEEDEEDNKKAYIEQWGERKELDEKTTHSDLNMKDLCLPEKKAFQRLEMVVAIEESKFEYGFMDEIYNSNLEFVLSRAKEMTTSSPFGDQDEINDLLFGTNGEAKKALDMTQNDSGKHLEMMIMERETTMESGAFKDVVRHLGVEQEENGEASNDRIVEGSRGLCEQSGALPHESSVTIVSEPEMNNHKDSIAVIAKEDVGIVHMKEDKMKVDESNYPLVDEGVEGLFVEIQGIEDCKLNNSEKTLESECQDGNQEVGSSPDEVEREDEIISVQYHEIETRHYIEAHNDKLERETEFPQIKESEAQIKEEVEERQILKLSFDLVEKGVKITNKTIKQDTKAELIDVLDKKHQCQVESYENNVSSIGKQQRIAIKKAKGTDYMFMRYPNGHIFLLTTLTTAILAFLFVKYFFSRTTILENCITC